MRVYFQIILLLSPSCNAHISTSSTVFGLTLWVISQLGKRKKFRNKYRFNKSLCQLFRRWSKLRMMIMTSHGWVDAFCQF